MQEELKKPEWIGDLIHDGFYDKIVLIGFPYDEGARKAGNRKGSDYGPGKFLTRSERPFKEMTFAEKRERIDYLLFKMKVICITISFIQRTRKLVEYRENENY